MSTVAEEKDTLEEFIRRNSFYGMGSVGSEYWRTRDLDIKEIAKLVRADIAKLSYKGKTSVKIERYAGGQSIRIVYKGNDKTDPASIHYALQHIADKYNYDFSNGQYDYFHRRFIAHTVVNLS